MPTTCSVQERILNVLASIWNKVVGVRFSLKFIGDGTKRMGMYQLDSVLASVRRVHSLRTEQLGCLPGPATDLGLDPEALLRCPNSSSL